MLFTVLKYLLYKPKCQHRSITPNNLERYCPDCGKEVVMYWQIVRCLDCETKRRGVVKLGHVEPEEKFCARCGSAHYFVETKHRLAYFDFNYALLVKETVENYEQCDPSIQIWVDGTAGSPKNERMKLLTTFAQ